MSPEQLKALRLIATAILETVREAGELGAPSGVMYAALSAQGCSLNQYRSIMAGLERAGLVKKEGDCYTSGSAATG
jgi:hypothetical protein